VLVASDRVPREVGAEHGDFRAPVDGLMVSRATGRITDADGWVDPSQPIPMDYHHIDASTSHDAELTPPRGRHVSHARRVRLLAGLTVAEVAEAAGISRQTLTAIELERSVPQLGTAQALADVLTDGDIAVLFPAGRAAS